MPYQSPLHHGVIADPARRAWQYGETLAASLIAYAARDAAFAAHLSARLRSALTPRADASRDTYESPRAGDAFRLLVPDDSEAAARRLEWLVGRLEDGTLPGADAAIDVLATWLRAEAARDPAPQRIVVGVVVVAVPGVTLGRFKMKRAAMTIIVRNDRAVASDWRLIQDITDASFGVVLRAIDMAGGDLGKLEPEVADWFFHDRMLALYGTSGRGLAAIRRELRSLDVVHAAIEDRIGTSIVAVSPTAAGAWQDIRWTLDPLHAA